ncbi:MAG TPA: tetratricopeptide repeat protein [Planctomycetota bacterium]|nr:tetratricopeptide repeat protein [Planctomycetota bacterium]
MERLKLNPKDAISFKELEEEYFYAQDWTKLLELYHFRADAIEEENVAEAARLYFKSGEIYEKKIGDISQSLVEYQTAFRLYPQEKKYGNFLSSYFLGKANWDEALKVLLRQQEHVKEKDVRISILIQIALLYQNQLKNKEETERFWSAILKLDPLQKEAFQALENLLHEDKQWEKLLSLYNSLSMVTPDLKVKKRLLEQSALICKDYLGNLPRALMFYKDLLKFDPKNLDLLKKIENIYMQLNEWNHVIEILEQELEFLDSSEQAQLYIRMAEISKEKLQNIHKAISYYECSLKYQETDSILQILEELYMSEKIWDKLADIYQKQAKLCQNADDLIELYCKLGSLYRDNINDVSSAIYWFEQAWQRSLKDLTILRSLQDLYKSQNDVLHLVQTYYDEISLVSGEKERVLLYYKIINIYKKQKDFSSIAQVYEKVLKEFPTHQKSLEEAKNVYWILQDYLAFLRVLNLQISHNEDSPEMIPLYLKRAEVWKEKLGNEEKAIETYWKILELDRSQLAVWDILYTYYLKNKDYEQVINALVNTIHFDFSRAEANYLEIALLYLDELKEESLAIEFFQKVLEINSCNMQAIKALSVLYEKNQDWEKYIENMVHRLELTMDPKERISLHFSLANVFHALKSDDEEKHLIEILKLDYSNRVAIESLKKFYFIRHEWQKFVELFEFESLVFSTMDEHLEQMYIEIATLYEDHLKNIPRCILFYEKARQLFPDRLVTLNALERLYESTEEYQLLIGVLENKARLAEDESVQKSLYCKIGTLWQEKLQVSKNAIYAFEKALYLDPTNQEALKNLETLYMQEENYVSLVRIFCIQADISSNVKDRISYYIQAALQYEEKLNNLEEAAKIYENILHLDEYHEIALKSLSHIYLKLEKWDLLSCVYSKIINCSEDQNLILTLSFELGEIYVDKLQAYQKAIGVYNDILLLHSGDLDAIQALENLYTKFEQWEKLENILQIKCSLIETDKEKIALFLRLGQLVEEKLCNFLKSFEYYKNVLTYQKDHRDAIHAMRKLAYKMQNFSQVIWTLDQELQFIKAPGERVELYFEKGDICREKLLDFDVAIDSYEHILEIGPGNLRAYQALVLMHQQRNEWNALLNVWERQIRISNPEEQKHLLLSSAKIWENNLYNDEEAKKCLLATLQLEPSFLEARDILNAIYFRLKEYELLIASYDEEIAITKDQKHLVELYYQQGKVWEFDLSNEEKALEAYYAVLQYDPHHLSAIKSLQRIFLKQSCYEQLLDAYQRELAVPNNEKERQIALYLFCADLQWKKLNNIDAAIKSYLAILDIQLDSNNLVAVRELQELYSIKKQYNELQVMLFKELELQKDSNRLIAVHSELAYLMEDKLQNIDVAIEHFSEVHLSRPNNLPILRRLKALLRKCERWEAYIDVAEKEIKLCSGVATLIPMHLDVLHVYDEHLENVQQAIVHGEIILKMQPHNLEVLRKLQTLYKKASLVENLVRAYLQEASMPEVASDEKRLIYLYQESARIYLNTLKRLENAAQCYEKVVQIDPAHRESLSGLVKIYSQLKNYENLIEIYEMAAQLSKNQKEVENSYLKIGEIWERELQNLPQALLSYQIVYTMNRENFQAVTGMRKIFEKEQRWGDAIEILNVEVTLCDEKKKPSLYLKMGEYWEEKLGMPHQALTCYLKVLGYGFHRPTAERIMKIQEQVCDYQGLVEILEKCIRTTDTDEESVARLLYLGRIQWKHLNYHDLAIETFNKVLKIDNKNMDAILALEELLENAKKWEELVDILQIKREIVHDFQDLLDVCIKIANIYHNQIHSGNFAIKFYEMALDLSPHHLDLIHILQSLYYEWGYYKKLIGLYQKEILLIEDQETIIQLYEKIGEILERKLFEEEQAIRTYEKLLEVDKSNYFAIQSLSVLYEKYQSWDKLIRVYNFLIEYAVHQGDTESKIYYLMKLGCLYRDEKHESHNAISVFHRIIEIEPSHYDALHALEDLYKNLDKSSEMAELLQQKLSMCTTDIERLELYIHLGSLYDKELENIDNAIQMFQQALELDPNRLEVLQALDSLYLRKNKWDELVEVCLREIELNENLEEKAELCFRLGVIYRDRFQDLLRAKTMFLSSIDYKANMRKALKALTGLAILEENWTQAVKYIGMEIVHIQDPMEKVESLTELGSLYQHKLKLIQKAKESFQKALDINPKSTIAIEAMADIYFTQKEYVQAEPLLGRLVLLVEKSNIDRMSNIYYKWGLVAEKLGKKDDAIVRYSNALKMQEDHFDSLCALGALYFERAQWGFDKSQWQEALDIYQKIYEHPKLESDDDVVRRLAVMYEKLGQIDTSIEYYTKVLANIPEDADSIQALARLYLKQGNDQNALHFLQRIIRSDYISFTERRSAYMTIAEVQTRLENHREAIEAHMIALEMGVEDPIILKKIGERYIALQEWDSACEWIEKHYPYSETDDEKVENRCLLGEIYIGRGNFDKALEIYRQALEANSTWVPAVQGLASIYEKQGLWNEVVRCYRDFLQNLPPDKKILGLPIYLALGNVFHEKLHDDNFAIKEYTEVLKLDPNHMAARIALATIRANHPKLRRDAIKDHLLLLQQEPLRSSSYRKIYELFQQENLHDSALCALRMLALQEKLLGSEQEFLEKNPPKCISRKVDFFEFNGTEEQKQLHTIMSLTADSMTKVYYADLEEKYGLRRKDRLTSDSNPVLWKIIEELRQILSISSIDVYVTPRKSHRILIENTQPISIILSQFLVEALSKSELYFLFARSLFYVCNNQFLVYKLSEKELLQYFRLLQNSFLDNPYPMTPDEEVLWKKIRNALPRKVRKILQEQPEIWQAISEKNIVSYVQTLEFATNHFALLAVDSLELTLQMIYKLHILQQTGKLIRMDKIHWPEVIKLDSIVDILQYNVSLEYTNMRKKLGIGI